jgi:isoleucyl-tRNA synthetase
VHNEELIDKKLEADFENCKHVMQAILSARESIGLGVRWPLKEAIVVTKDNNIAESVMALKEIVKSYTNVKDVRLCEKLEGIKLRVKADSNQIMPDFKELAPKVIARLTFESPESILSHLDREDKFVMEIDGKKVNIVSEHLIITREVPKQYTEAVFKAGFVYLNRELTDELEAEGYARESIRRVQALRKKAGLEKRDRINLVLKADAELCDYLKQFYEHIKARVNAKAFKIGELEPVKKVMFFSKEKIKDKVVAIYLEKL